MSHLAYYQYQATARGIHSLEDVQRNAHEKAYLYDRIVLPWLPIDKTSRLAELACGHGSFLCWLKERGFTRLEGIDSSSEQVAFAGRVAPVHQVEVNDWLASQKDASCAALIAIDLIEHLSKDAFVELLKNAYRVLEPNGKLIVRYPNGESPLVGRNLFNDITHVWTYTPNCLNSLASMHRFAKVEFVDESHEAIRDHRWLKVPMSRIATGLLRMVFRAATRENVDYWSPHLWASLNK
jgi:cyclopropane fatty-acyl-phospholipid synthase-like methyltransferase